MAQHRHLLWKSCQHLQKHRAFPWRFKGPPGPSWTLAARKACAATSACTVNSGGATEPSAALELERPIFSGKSRDHEIAWKTFACNISTHVILHMLHLKKICPRTNLVKEMGIHCVNENWDILVTAEWSNLLPLAFVETTFVTPHHTCVCNTFTPSSHKNCGPSARTNTNKKTLPCESVAHHCQVQAPFCTGFFSSTLFGGSFTLDAAP